MFIISLLLKLIILTPNVNMNVDRVIKAISMVESGNNKNAIGDKWSKNNYSVGLCQIRINTAKFIIKKLIKNKKVKNYYINLIDRIGIVSLLKIRKYNKFLCKTYILWIKRKYNYSWFETIISYNTGPNAKLKVKTTLGLNYLQKVLKYY